MSESQAAATSELQVAGRLKIHDGKLEEYERLAEKCVEIGRTKDTGTLHYELYFNDDNSECLFFERSRDSRTLLKHNENPGDLMAAILQTCSGSGVVCGTPGSNRAAQGFARSGLYAISGRLVCSGG